MLKTIDKKIEFELEPTFTWKIDRGTSLTTYQFFKSAWFKNENKEWEQLPDSEVKMLKGINDPGAVIAIILESMDCYRINGIVYFKEVSQGFLPILDEKEFMKNRLIDYYNSKLAPNDNKELVDKILAKMPEYKVENNHYQVYVGDNQIIDLKKGEIFTHNLPFAPGTIPVHYIPMEDQDKEIKKMVMSWFAKFGNKSKVLAIQEAMGAALIDTEAHQTFFQIVGEGGTGTSFINKMIQSVLGPANYSILTAKQLHEKFLVSSLLNVHVNIGGEINGNYTNDAAVIKAISAGDSITADVKNVKPIKFRPRATLYFSGNDVIRFGKELNNSLKRRLRMIYLDKIQKKSNVFEIIQRPEVKECLFAFMIEGAMRYIKQDFRLTKDFGSLDKLDEWAETNDNVYAFFEQRIGMKTGDIESKLIMEYREWCKDNKLNANQSRDFRKSIKTKYGITWRQVTTRGAKDYVFIVPQEVTDKWNEQITGVKFVEENEKAKAKAEKARFKASQRTIDEELEDL